MKRKTMVPVLIFAVSVTAVALAAGFRGNFFQASLLSETSISVESGSQLRAPSLVDPSSGELSEFPIFEERSMVYRAALEGNKALGLYFPSIYRFEEASEGLITVGFRPEKDVMIEKSLRLTISYPGQMMDYAGVTTASSSGATMTVDISQPNLLIVELMPTTGQVLRYSEEIPAFLQLPMRTKNTNRLVPNNSLQMRITNVEHVTFGNTTEEWPFYRPAVELIYYTPATTSDTRPVLTGEPRPTEERGVLTMELRETNPSANENGTPIDQTNTTVAVEGTTTTASTSNGTSNPSYPAGDVQAFRMPLVTQDQTRISPPLIRAQSGETVYVYISATDPDGQDDIKSVEMDLSIFGLASRVPLVQTNTGPKYSIFGGSFILPDAVVAQTAPYQIPYSIMDGGSNYLKGTLQFVVRPSLDAQSATVSTALGTQSLGSSSLGGVSLLDQQVTPTKSRSSSVTDIETDLNGDGKVDDTDLAIYLFTFQMNKD